MRRCRRRSLQTPQGGGRGGGVRLYRYLPGTLHGGGGEGGGGCVVCVPLAAYRYRYLAVGSIADTAEV